MADSTPSVAASALIEVAEAAGHQVETHATYAEITTTDGVVRLDWYSNGYTVARWRHASVTDPLDFRGVSLSAARHYIA